MSAKAPRVFTREFKIDVCRQVHSGQKRPAQVCREHQLTESLLLRWRREFEQRGEDGFSAREASPTEALEQKLADLERFCGQLSLENALSKLENALLKKLVSRSRFGGDTPFSALCRSLGVSRSWFYVSRSWFYERPGSQEPTEEAIRLRDAVERLCLAFPGYGYRRVCAQLRRDGWAINRKRVLRVMREESLLCRLQKAFRPASPGSTRQAYPNLLKDRDLTAPDQAWVADITYIHLPRDFVYLACVLDAFSRRCVGWHLSEDIDTRLTLSALDKALALRRPAPGLIHHSDRGVQYVSTEYVARLNEAGLRPSMSAAGCPYDNAKAESFFKTLKKEEVNLTHYQNFAEAYAHIGTFLEDVYNVKRLHSSLGYRPPVEFEDVYAQPAYAQTGKS